jgi:hypothetical protein
VASPGILIDELFVSHRTLSAQQLPKIFPKHRRAKKTVTDSITFVLKCEIFVTNEC